MIVSFHGINIHSKYDDVISIELNEERLDGHKRKVIYVTQKGEKYIKILVPKCDDWDLDKYFNNKKYSNNLKFKFHTDFVTFHEGDKYYERIY